MPSTLSGIAASRLIGRHVTRRSAASAQRWRAAFDLDFVQLMLAQVTLSANLSHLRQPQAGLLAPDGLRRPVRVSAVARSMGLPGETLRRRALVLAQRGLMQRTAAGFIVPRALLAETAGIALIADDAAELRALADELATMRVEAASRLAPDRIATVADDALARRFLDLNVRAVEPLIDTFGDWATASVAIRLISANVEHIAADRALSERWAHHDTVPPDSERRPIAVRELARLLCLPYPSVRRRINLLVARGQAIVVRDGVIVPSRVLQGETFARNNLKLTGHVETMLAELERA